MNENINAFGILLIAVLVIIVCLRFRTKDVKKIFRVKRIILSLVVSGVACLGVSVSTFHLCKEGNPFFQWLVPCIGIFCVLMVVEKRVIKIISAVVLIIAAYVLSSHFNQMVHTKDYTGNPDTIVQRNIRMSERNRENFIYKKKRAKQLWHTLFTGIYSVEEIPFPE